MTEKRQRAAMAASRRFGVGVGIVPPCETPSSASSPSSSSGGDGGKQRSDTAAKIGEEMEGEIQALTRKSEGEVYTRFQERWGFDVRTEQAQEGGQWKWDETSPKSSGNSSSSIPRPTAATYPQPASTSENVDRSSTSSDRQSGVPRPTGT